MLLRQAANQVYECLTMTTLPLHTAATPQTHWSSASSWVVGLPNRKMGDGMLICCACHIRHARSPQVLCMKAQSPPGQTAVLSVV